MSNTKTATQKVPVVEQVTELAMKLGQRHLAEYGATRSRHDFTQRQLMTCLILRAYLKTTYRGVLDLLATSPSLRQRMGLTDKLAARFWRSCKNWWLRLASRRRHKPPARR